MSSKCKCKLWDLEGFSGFKERRIYLKYSIDIYGDYEEEEEDGEDIEIPQYGECFCTSCGQAISPQRCRLIENYGEVLASSHKKRRKEYLVKYLFSNDSKVRKLATYLLKYKK